METIQLLPEIAVERESATTDGPHERAVEHLAAAPASLRGVRVACFYPWNSFEPTGAWSRFACLWNFLVEEGAEVTLAFFDKGTNAQLKGISVKYQGDYNVISNIGTFARAIVAAESKSELNKYSQNELNFLLMYEKGLYLGNPRLGPWVDEIVKDHDVITCEYPMYAPLLSGYCKQWKKPLVVSSLDVLFELHGKHPGAKARLKQKEVDALALADALVFCNEAERKLFAQSRLKGVTVLNTGDVLSVIPGQEEQSRESVRAELNIKTAHYCFFIGSAHIPNTEASAEVRRMAKSMPEMTFVVAGSCCVKLREANFIALGQASEELIDRIYRGALAVIVPLLHGTGMSVKVFQAFTYQKAVVSTPIGIRGFSVRDGKELLIASSPGLFPTAIRRLLMDAGLRKRIAHNARELALTLDYRTHFSPYRDIVLRLLNKPMDLEAKAQPALILVDNNLKDRVGHHFNYALALKEQLAERNQPFSALVKNGADDDVLSSLSAQGVFSSGIHGDNAENPYPVDWGNIRALYDFLQGGDQFAKELECGLAQSTRMGDLVFLPNATPPQMLGLALLLLRSPLYRALRFVLILRYSVHTPSGPLSDRKVALDREVADRYALAIEKLVSADPRGAVRFATDSAELAKEYAAFAKRPFEVLPIPHTIHQAPNVQLPEIPAKDSRKIRVVYMGDAREEKGFELLPAVVRACVGDPSMASVEFVFQAFISSHYHQKMAVVIDELAKLKLSQVYLVKSPLSPDGYQSLLASADLVLLPYDAATYRARTSGPFVEAICADKPVVIPSKSWMSTQLAGSPAGITFVSGNLQDCARAVRELITNLPAHAEAAAEIGKRFREYHNPANFISALTKNSE